MTQFVIALSLPLYLFSGRRKRWMQTILFYMLVVSDTELNNIINTVWKMNFVYRKQTAINAQFWIFYISTFLMQIQKLLLFISIPVLKQPIFSHSWIHTEGGRAAVTILKGWITTVIAFFSMVLIILNPIGYSPMLHKSITAPQNLRWISLLGMFLIL